MMLIIDAASIPKPGKMAIACARKIWLLTISMVSMGALTYQICIYVVIRDKVSLVAPMA